MTWMMWAMFFGSFAVGYAVRAFFGPLWKSGERFRVLSVTPTTDRRSLNVSVSVYGQERLYTGAVTVWHLITSSGLVRAPTWIEWELANVWTTHRYNEQQEMEKRSSLKKELLDK